MIRIWHQSFTDLSSMPLYAETLAHHAERVMPEGTVVIPHGLRPGTYAGGVAPIDAIRHRYLEFLNELQICEAALTAQREGFDAVAIGCFFDPALREARSIVGIPVVSLAESCLLASCSLGRAAGVVTLCGDESANLVDLAHKYGLGSRLATVIGLEPPIDEFALEADQRQTERILESFELASRQVINAGAELVIPGDGVLNEFLVRQGYTATGGVPVMDSIAVLFHHAQMLVLLQRATGLTVSRHQFYASPSPQMLQAARSFAGLAALTSNDFSSYRQSAASRSAPGATV